MDDKIVKDHIAKAQSHLELAISMTPTGPTRNVLTDANIELMQAQQALGDGASNVR